MRAVGAGRRTDETGQVTVLIIGFAAILAALVVVVTIASSAYLQRQGLDTLADGAALHGSDLGAAGVYEGGLDGERLLQDPEAVRAAVEDYLTRARADARFEGIRSQVGVDATAGRVTVTLTAPLDLPSGFGAFDTRWVSATSSASVQIQR
ncbi:MAG: hypothetical protein ACI379_01130 [Nocardioides sp.]|uniref:pilus assembly protein TadG-related protein n=1 Tax=Nocardioides sp. TaxID=35761 RepID=UPI003F115493